ncbi:hypothetical protein N7476_005300 [Penicillium atrosanguineum]|uniref:Uncharacterized protein n=1 Tax=Penicillium atrosanguineum TaxID=1132637 RepID=A0A9W9PY82_9EURO|nr:hypothetical protein N7476_005300 [Penicillium atrosanguineum]
MTRTRERAETGRGREGREGSAARRARLNGDERILGQVERRFRETSGESVQGRRREADWEIRDKPNGIAVGRMRAGFQCWMLNATDDGT